MQNKEATVTVSSQEYAHFQQLDSELSYVKQQLADLQRLIFGKSSERFIPSDSNHWHCFRPLALGRKNYLFAGSHAAAQKAAMMYSFFATCKLHQVEPYQWFKDVLSRIPDHKVNQLQELLPHNWKPAC